MRPSLSRKSTAALAAAALLALPLTACSNDAAGAGNGGSGSSQSQPPAPVASIPKLSGESTMITFDQGFADALTQLKLKPGAVGDATLTPTDVEFPITGGNVTVFKPGDVDPYVIGQLQHEGSGLSLTAGGTTVELTNLNVDPGVSKVYGDVAVNGQTAVTSAPLFNLDGRTLQPLKTEGSQAILEGTKVTISEDAAPLLNDTFKTDAVTPGLLVGVAKITVNTK